MLEIRLKRRDKIIHQIKIFLIFLVIEVFVICYVLQVAEIQEQLDEVMRKQQAFEAELEEESQSQGRSLQLEESQVCCCVSVNNLHSLAQQLTGW